MMLRHVSSNVLSGLIETLAAPPYNGHADLPVLANQLQLEADEIFHLGESLQLLRFAQLSEGDLTLTDAGKRFAHLDTDARKKLFAERLMDYVPVMGLIRRVLDERPSHTAPAARFRNELEDYMSEDYADDTLKTIVSWGRYAELFADDEQSELQPGKPALSSAASARSSAPRNDVPAAYSPAGRTQRAPSTRRRESEHPACRPSVHPDGATDRAWQTYDFGRRPPLREMDRTDLLRMVETCRRSAVRRAHAAWRDDNCKPVRSCAARRAHDCGSGPAW